MVYENPEKNCIYTVYNGGLHDLAEEVNSFCVSKYGDSCEFRQVDIKRISPDGHEWTLHEFSRFDSETVRAIENHLKTRRDSVRVKFGDAGSQVLELLICHARNTSQLSRHTDKQDREGFESGDLVVLAIDGEENVLSEARNFLESIE